MKPVFVVTPMHVDTKWGRPVVFLNEVDAKKYAEEYEKSEKCIRCDVEICVMWEGDENERK